jgi:plastocyanin
MISKRFAILVIVIVALAALIAACGPGATSGGGGGGGSNDLNVTITATEFKYDPNTISASPGQKVNVTLVNKGTVIHTFVLAEANVTITAQAGQSATGSFTAPAAGTYTFFCDQPGHKDAGMTGTLTVK